MVKLPEGVVGGSVGVVAVAVVVALFDSPSEPDGEP